MDNFNYQIKKIMKMRNAFVLILICLVNANAKSCNITNTTSEYIMDCSGLGFTDCPVVNTNVTHLILDNNSLKSLTSSNCSKWTNLRKLSVRNNSLSDVPKFDTFNSLQYLDLSRNKLDKIVIDSFGLQHIDVSYNLIKSVDLSGLRQLDKLFLRQNQINNENLDKLIKSLHNKPSLTELDLSYNLVDKLLSGFITYAPQVLTSLNFSSNKFRSINFIYFKSKNFIKASIDFSNNSLQSVVSTGNSNPIGKLNFSINQLARIEVDTLTKFGPLKRLDLSENPLNCLCNESAAFIEWLQANRSIIAHKSQTRCKSPPYQSILDISCPHSPTTSTRPSTSPSRLSSTSPSTPSRASSSIHTITTSSTNHSPEIAHNAWKIAVGLLVPGIVIISLLLIYVHALRRRHRYRQLSESNKILPFSFSDCIPLRYFGSRNETTSLLVDAEEDRRQAFDEQRLNFEDTLLIICSSKDTRWVKDEIAVHLGINKQFVDGKVKRLPYSDFTLIVVNGNMSLRDHTFINNVQMALQEKDQEETKLMVNTIPSSENLQRMHPATDYIRQKLNKNYFFNSDREYRTFCITSMKTWLNLDIVPHNV